MTLLDSSNPAHAGTTRSMDRCPHEWTVESRHTTSEGLVRYLRCPACGGRCVDLLPHAQRNSSPGMSRTVRANVTPATTPLQAG